MSLLVVTYPELEQIDFEWIQNYRKQNDTRYYSVIDPHFTIVFAIDDIDQSSIVKEVRQKAKDISPFEFECKVATINQNDDGSYYHEFLVPEMGYSNIIKLHDHLYSDRFAPHLRFDIDYIPHIGIGNSIDAEVSKRRIDELNADSISIRGNINALTVIEYKDNVVTPVEKIVLS